MKTKDFKRRIVRVAMMLFVLVTTTQAWAQTTMTWTFSYTGAIQIFTAPKAGIYELQVWGAQGGNRGLGGGLGGYATCRTLLTEGETIYVYIGGQGGAGSTPAGGAGGWNGGGKGGTGYGYLNGSAGGGGATHISKVNNQVIGSGSGQCASLVGTNYIIVAGGGGGAGFPEYAGAGGGTEGGLGILCGDLHPTYSDHFYYSESQSYGADGGNGNDGGWNCEGAGGGGGGYYGGTASYPYSTFPTNVYANASGCGGNSAYNINFATHFSTTAGQREGNGQAQITLLLQGSGTLGDPYLIPSTEVWNFLADNVNAGNTYSGKYFRLTNDISVTTMVGAGTSDGNFKSFNGTFDGNRKTLDVSISGTGSWTALFGALSGATIKNLHITGSITTDGVRVASIAGFISGNTTIENCWSEVAISSSQANNWVDAGAFVARINSGNTLTLNGCLFTGSITYSDENAYEGGGMVGWAQDNTIAKFYDCVFAPSAISITKYQDQYMFVASYEDYVTRTIDNCYYNDVANATSMTKEGKHGHSITAGDDVTISGLGTESATYSVSGITTYSHGIKYNGNYYAENEDEVSLSLSHNEKTGYTFSQYAVTGGGSLANPTTNTPTLTMTDADQTIGAVWTRNMVTLADGVDLSASELTSYTGKQCDVSYTREFTSGKTSTVCLPFAYTKQGTEGSFYEFTSIEKNGSGEYVATMTEPVSTTLAANTPYLFTPAASSVTFTGTIANVPTTFTAGETEQTDWTFKGTFATIEWPTAPTGTYGFSAQNVDAQGISQGQFVKVGEYVRIKSMRCYLEYTGEDTNWAEARGMNRATAEESLPETISVRLVNSNGDLNAIGTLHTQTGEVTQDGWYTLDGTRLTGQPTRKGIYIVNGRKVIIK